MMGQGGMDGSMMGGWGPFGWLGMLIPLLFWGGLLVLIAWAVVKIVSAIEYRQRTRPHTHGHEEASSAEEILMERFARGEIDAKEFEERRRILRGEDT